MDHDAAHKLYHALPEVVADLLRLAVPDLVDDLDLSTLERMSGESVDTRLLTRVSDMVWRVRFKHGRLADGARPWLLLLVEFQSTVDRRMAERAREYTAMLLEALDRNGTVKREGGPPPVLAMVVYNGSERWAVGGEAGSVAAGLASPRVARLLAPFQPQAYRLVDAGARSAHDWPPENRVAASIRLQRSRSAGELLGRLREEMARFPGEGNEALREGLHAWARALWSHLADGRAELPSFEALERGEEDKMTTLLEARAEEWKAEWLAEGIEKGIEQGIEQGRAEERARQGERMATLLEARAEEWKAEWLAEGIEKGIEKGIEQGRAEERARQGERMAALLEARAEEWKAELLAEGIEKGIKQGRAEERALLDRLAALKFGARTAERLSDMLDGLTSPEELLEVGSWIIECDTDADLLDRVRAHAERSRNGEC